MSTVAFAVSSVHPAAAPYYRLFPLEPIAPMGSTDFLTITRVHEMSDNRIETLLAAIPRFVGEKGTIVVVSHGNDHGLSFTVGAGRGVSLGTDTIQTLRSNLAGQLDDAETAKRLKMSHVEQLKALKAVWEPVRKLGLGRVELRACTTGKKAETLRQLQFFFNADLCCAPDEWDTFGPIPFSDLTSNPMTWSDFRRDHPGATIYGSGKQRFSLSYKVLGDQQKVMLAAIADSEDAVKGWVANHLPPGNYARGPLYYHGLTDKTKITFAGEAGYRGHLIAVTDGKGTTTANPGVLNPRNLP